MTTRLSDSDLRDVERALRHDVPPTLEQAKLMLAEVRASRALSPVESPGEEGPASPGADLDDLITRYGEAVQQQAIHAATGDPALIRAVRDARNDLRSAFAAAPREVEEVREALRTRLDGAYWTTLVKLKARIEETISVVGDAGVWCRGIAWGGSALNRKGEDEEARALLGPASPSGEATERGDGEGRP